MNIGKVGVRGHLPIFWIVLLGTLARWSAMPSPTCREWLPTFGVGETVGLPAPFLYGFVMVSLLTPVFRIVPILSGPIKSQCG